MGAISTIGNILPILTGAAGVVKTIGTTLETTLGLGQSLGNSQAAEQKLAMKQLRQKQALEEGQLNQKSDLQRQQNALQAAQEDEDRQQALRRAVARQRAQFGSQGVGSNGGSGEAVLLGLFDETDAERAKREQLDSVRNTALDMNESQSRSLNLLQATQLAQRQKLQNLY